MAEEWIKWVKGLSRRREVLAMARTLKKDRRIVACACMELWEWADENTSDGVVDGVTLSDIDDEVGMRGFAAALEHVGWITTITDGVEFSHWDRHNGTSAKRRALDKERKRAERDCPQSVRDLSAFEADKKRTRGEERREEGEPVQSNHSVSISSPVLPSGGNDSSAGGVDWAGVFGIRGALEALGIWPVVVDWVCGWEPGIDAAEVRRVWEYTCSDRGVRDRRAVFVHRLCKAHDKLDDLPRGVAGTDYERVRAKIVGQLRKLGGAGTGVSR